MAYIGAEPVPGQNREVDDISSGFNGNATAFTLQVSSVNVSPESANNILINLGGVLQNPGTDYTIAASTITFTTAPAAGLSFFGLILGAGINTATVADDTIGPSKLIDTAVTAGSYTTADITVDAQGRITAAASGTISGAEIADQAVTNAKVNNSAAIAGTKISPDFGSQNIVTTGIVKVGDGSASAPSLAFSDDTNTGIFSSADNKINFTTGGTEKFEIGSETIFNENGEDIDFRVESTSNANVLKCDAGNSRVGINVSAPLSALNVNGEIFFGDSQSSLNSIAKLSYGANSGVLDIKAHATGNTTIAFTTSNSGSHSERMRIDSSGRILVGHSSSRTVGTKTGQLQIINGGNDAALSIIQVNNAASAPFLCFGKTRSGNVTGSTTVQNGDSLGQILFAGADGTDVDSTGATITAQVDKAPGSNDMPGRLVFSTTADGSSTSTERLRIDSSGNCIVQGGNIEFKQQSNSLNTENGQLGSGNTSQANNSRIVFRTEGAVNNGGMSFHTMAGGTDNEVFRINKTRQFLFDATTASEVGLIMIRNTTSPYHRVQHGGSGSSFANHTLIEFKSTVDGTIGEIKQDGDGTITYATSSDYRLKENIVDLTGGITRLKNLKPKRFNFKKNSSITKDGFLAHELQEVIPEAVNGTKDEVVTEDSKANMPQLAEEEVGNPVYQTADLTRVVPLLTAALQESIAKIETLETKVAALEAA